MTSHKNSGDILLYVYMCEYHNAYIVTSTLPFLGVVLSRLRFYDLKPFDIMLFRWFSDGFGKFPVANSTKRVFPVVCDVMIYHIYFNSVKSIAHRSLFFLD